MMKPIFHILHLFPMTHCSRKLQHQGSFSKVLVSKWTSIWLQKAGPSAGTGLLYTHISHFTYSGHTINISSPENKAFYFALEFIFNSSWKSLSHNNVLFTTHAIYSTRQIARHLTA